MSERPKPTVLTVMDGWGYRAETKGNAIALAQKPAYDELLRKFPNTLIHTSGAFVGLPEGQMGNSEVGHLSMGAGRIVHMDVTRIDQLIATKLFFKTKLFVQAMTQDHAQRLHLIGLLSDGGVHSHINHLFALLEMAKHHKVNRVFVHCFMDGRDTPSTSGRDYLLQLQQKMHELECGEIATVIGRYYAMDRDNRWERVEKAYRAMVHGEGEIHSDNPISAIQRSYEQELTDEFVKPTVITRGSGSAAKPIGPIRDNDAVIFYNFRSDRARQITKALVEPGFAEFTDAKRPKKMFFVAMTQYEKTWRWLQYVIEPEKLEHILAEVFTTLHYKNLRCAETEKYAHVTHFFNGGVEKPYGGEERILVPSPKVATYDLKPEMAAAAITDVVVKAIETGEFEVIIMNYANADMVGHSGNLEAAIKAVEAVDAGLARIYQTLKQRGGAWIVTADHGNAETMIDPMTGGPHTYHTTNPVPFIFVSGDEKLRLRSGGSLRDIAPTLLGILGQPCPLEMTGSDLRVVAR